MTQRLPLASGELLPVPLVEALADLQPLLQRARRAGWRLMVIGARTAEDRQAATKLTDRVWRLADAMETDD